MNLVSSSGSNLVEDNAMDYQRHALGAATIEIENNRSRRDRIAIMYIVICIAYTIVASLRVGFPVYNSIESSSRPVVD